MTRSDQQKIRRVLIASSHGLFGQGLRSLLEERKQADVEVVGIVSNLDEALQALEKFNPDLLIVDYDDETLNRDEFLARFVEGEKKLRLVLLSLQSAKEALVYERRSLAAAQIDEWLEEWTTYADDLIDYFITYAMLQGKKMDRKEVYNYIYPQANMHKSVYILGLKDALNTAYIRHDQRLFLPFKAEEYYKGIDSFCKKPENSDKKISEVILIINEQLKKAQ